MAAYPQSMGAASNIGIDTSELVALAKDLDHHQRVEVRNITNRALSNGVDYLYNRAVASATPLKDTGLMLSSIHKDNGKGGYSRRVWCGPDPAGFMVEFGAHGRPPISWLFVHADPAARIVEALIAQDVERDVL